MAGTGAAHGPITVCTVGGMRSATKSHPVGAGPSSPGPSYEAGPAVRDFHPPSPLIDVEGDEDGIISLHPSDEKIDILSVDQQGHEGEEELGEKWSPLLQGLISRAAAALSVEMPPEQGLAPLRFR